VNLGLGLGCLRVRGDGLVEVVMSLVGVSVIIDKVNAACYFKHFSRVQLVRL
jgi:hypothetical protein